MSVQPVLTSRRPPRRRRLIGALALSIPAWLLANGLPIDAAGVTQPTIESQTLTLTGADAAEAAITITAAPASKAGRSAAPTATAGPGWAATVDVEDGTQSVGVTWRDAPTGAVRVRGLAAGTWGDWQDLQADPTDRQTEEEPDAGGLAWLGGAGVTEIQVEVLAGDLRDLTVQTIRYEAGRTASGLSGSQAGANDLVRPRSAWAGTKYPWASANQDCSTGPESAAGGAKYAIVHHTASSNSYTANDVPAIIASLYAFHTNPVAKGGKGWCDVAYNFIVDKFGVAWEARTDSIAKPIVGGHAAGFNRGSFGVSLLGQYEPTASSPAPAKPSASQIDKVGRVIGWKLGLVGADPTGNVTVTPTVAGRYPKDVPVTIKRVSGHIDVGYTSCPGADVISQLGTIRTKAKAYQTSNPPTTTTTTTTTTTPPPAGTYAPFTNADQLIATVYLDVVRRSADPGAYAYWRPLVGTTSWPPEKFVAHLLTTEEVDRVSNAVVRLYTSFFRRSPDYGGLNNWITKRKEGQTLQRVADQFAGAPEFTRTYGSLTNAQYVDRVYQNVLGRAPDAAGRTYWANRLGQGTSRGEVMLNFSESAEFKAATRWETHLQSAYAALLHRTPTADEAHFYRTMSSPTTSIIKLIWDSPAYRNRFS